MHDNLKQRLREEIAAGLATRPPSDLSDVLRRGQAKRRGIRLTAIVATALFALLGGFVVRSTVSTDAAPVPPAEDRKDTPVNFPDLTTTFVSPTHGFSVKHPDAAEVTPAENAWDGGHMHHNDGFDVVETGHAAVFRGASAAIPGGIPIDDWVDEVSEDWPGGCGEPRSRQAKITLDGWAGRISECPNRIEATIVTGARLYLFTLTHERDDARAVFDAFTATIDLTPETALFLPKMTGTFDSPTYGYSYSYRGILEPATRLWDPTFGMPWPIDDRRSAAKYEQYEAQFDFVETGSLAVFTSASTEIPDGVSVDEWVDDVVVKHLASPGCYVPRSQQETITLDGRPGKVLQCANEFVATVVVDGRLYLFMLGDSRNDGTRAWFDAWIATIELTPETAEGP